MEAILGHWVPPLYFNRDSDRFTRKTIGIYESDGQVRFDKDNPTEPFKMESLFDKVTQNFYLVQNPLVLRFKSFLLLTLGVPLHFIGTLIWNVAKLSLELIKFLFRKVNLAKIKEHFHNCRRAPYYALGCEMAAITALLTFSGDPTPLYRAHAIFAEIEKKWNHDLPRQKDAIRHFGELGQETKTFFMAYCFQPLGSSSSPRYYVV
ncbi:MAG: hypothetical protein KBC64_01445 [Simkaniaceae bacterium]|nr:hypothetical protein [Simkaniaceae bacterium]